MHSEIGEMLLGLKRRFELLNVDNPWAVVVDNCCHFRNMIVNVFPEVAVLQDVWQVIMRYTFFLRMCLAFYNLIIFVDTWSVSWEAQKTHTAPKLLKTSQAPSSR